MLGSPQPLKPGTHVWPTTPDDLMGILRQALLALAPVMEEAHIPLEEGSAYDDWDEVAQTLYKNVVVRSIQWSEGLDLQLRMPAYDMLYDDYSQFAYVAVKDGRSGPGSQLAFHSFVPGARRRFDTVRCIGVSNDGRALDRGQVVAIDAVSFILQLPNSLGGRQIDTLKVRL